MEILILNSGTSSCSQLCGFQPCVLTQNIHMGGSGRMTSKLPLWASGEGQLHQLWFCDLWCPGEVVVCHLLFFTSLVPHIHSAFLFCFNSLQNAEASLVSHLPVPRRKSHSGNPDHLGDSAELEFPGASSTSTSI